MIEISVQPNVTDFPHLAEKALKEWVAKKNDEFLQKLLEEGKKVAEQIFGSAALVYIDKTQDGYALIAEGEAVCFIEFGTGVYADPKHEFANDMPFVIAPGSWSESDFGKHTWSDWVNAGKDPKYYPFNRHPKYPMWEAYKALQANMDRIAKEVYK